MNSLLTGVYGSSLCLSVFTYEITRLSGAVEMDVVVEARPRRFKQLRMNLRIKSLSQTSVLYLTLHSLVILIVGFYL